MGAPRSTIKEKVDWMVRNHHLWRGWPNASYTDNQIISKMQDDGVVSRNSNTYDVMDFGKLVGLAREAINQGKRRFKQQVRGYHRKKLS